ncbi:peptidoglycan bridge formation glycyltransferase FemA/FemB family protein [candidate division WS5 bacterium]|uniref:Peptidoglycan bridge formation glycyltransferase FemA/FemB family protein n=1 Tax=candidate division WS5 bacterium TaxID=2093353 RepID=A0A419DDE1_9BACT|nr:MAG: peptidoglycan bridge formation glycyltransferase FemA/FemB family protein [candidate division WS5 bacterium]
MIDIKKTKKKLIPYMEGFFYEKPKHFDALRMVDYNATRDKKNYFGFKRKIIYTKIIDLTCTPDELLAQFRKNTKYEIKRAEKEGIKFAIESNLDTFLCFYNSFAESKKQYKEVPPLKRNDFECLTSYLIITKAVFENEILVMHSYLIDKDIKRVRLLNTSSLFRHEHNSQKKCLIGRANRFLHFQDMIYFRNEGFEIYDMGGYAHNTKDKEKQKISEFKDSFGGELIEESAYTSLPLYICREIIKLIGK